MSNPVLVTNEAQALDNIQRFKGELDRSPGLQERLAYARAWYTGFESDGSYTFGPSKFIGYRELSADEYLAGGGLDGRQTEHRLRQWFVEIGPDHIAYAPLLEQLHDFLAGYGKAPSSAMRINIPIAAHDEALANVTAFTGDSDHMLAELLIAVAQRLPHAERLRVREAL
jgi:hypothetical protein